MILGLRRGVLPRMISPGFAILAASSESITSPQLGASSRRPPCLACRLGSDFLHCRVFSPQSGLTHNRSAGIRWAASSPGRQSAFFGGDVRRMDVVDAWADLAWGS